MEEVWIDLYRFEAGIFWNIQVDEVDSHRENVIRSTLLDISPKSTLSHFFGVCQKKINFSGQSPKISLTSFNVTLGDNPSVLVRDSALKKNRKVSIKTFQRMMTCD